MSQVFVPDDKDRKKKYNNWREAVYDKPTESNIPHWRSTDNPNYNSLDSDRVFKTISQSRRLSEQEAAKQLPTELTDITKDEAVKMGYCEDTRNKMNSVRAMKRNQFYASRGIRNYEE